ncbi:L,D-transpeptidase family protein [bacterium]|nr:L,D-transpeptidase family protein [bacterium]
MMVIKQANELSVRPLNDFNRIIYREKAISGSNPGDKEVEGDEKTPEGIYFVTGKISKSLMTSLHGAVAFGLSYPNSFDRSEKKTGYGIWIHGVDSPDRMEKRFDTKGCVALSNEHVSELGKYLRHEIPVIIVDTVKDSVKVKLQYKTGDLVDRTKAWAAAWSSMDLDSYMSFYHPDFKSREMNWNQWKDYKGQLVKNYKTIDVQLADVLVIDHPKYMYSVFEQRYESNRYRANGMKRLFWKKSESGEQKIVIEEGFRQATGYIN